MIHQKIADTVQYLEANYAGEKEQVYIILLDPIGVRSVVSLTNWTKKNLLVQLASTPKDGTLV